MGLFVTFEGGEGTGKTTQVDLLVRALRADGVDVVALREPGGTRLGDQVRDWVKATDVTLAPETELLLFAAARAELVHTAIRPALAAGKVVVLDRYADSTTVYQGDGRGLPLGDVEVANRIATGGLAPDVTFLLDGPVDAMLGRALLRGEDGAERFEGEGAAFHERVRAGFLRLAGSDPRRWTVVDSTGDRDAVHGAIVARVRGLLRERGIEAARHLPRE